MNKIHINFFAAVMVLISGAMSAENVRIVKRSTQENIIRGGIILAVSTAGAYTLFKVYQSLSSSSKKEEDKRPKKMVYEQPVLTFDGEIPQITLVDPLTLEKKVASLSKPLVFYSLQKQGEASKFDTISPDLYMFTNYKGEENTIHTSPVHRALLQADPALERIIIGIGDLKGQRFNIYFPQGTKVEPEVTNLTHAFELYNHYCLNDIPAVLIVVPFTHAPADLVNPVV